MAPKKPMTGVSPHQPQPQSQPQLIGSVGSMPRPIPTPNPNSIQAAAFAAGGRIANPSTARSLLEAAKSKNVVHIRSGSISLSSKPIMAAHTTINLSTIRASSSSLQTSSLNQHLNSSPGNGAAQVLKKLKTTAATGDEVEMEVKEADGKKDASKLNGDDKTATNKESLQSKEKNGVSGCLIVVEKPNGGVVSSNVKTVGLPETDKKENQTVVLSQSKEKTNL